MRRQTIQALPIQDTRTILEALPLADRPMKRARDPVLRATLDQTFVGTLAASRQTDRARMGTKYGRETDTGAGEN